MYSKRIHSITHLVCVGWSTQSQSIITGLVCVAGARTGWSTQSQSIITGLVCVAGARTTTLFNTAGMLLSLSLSLSLSCR
jgi:hypothetical protein